MKQLQSNQEFRFNEILFEHRNKEYGAYVLRNESDKILTKALFIGVSLLAAISISPFVVSAFESEVPTKIPEGVEIVLRDPVVPEQLVAPPKDNPVKPATAPDVKTVDERLPEPKAHVTNEKVVEKIEGAIAGVKNNPEGEVAPPNKYVPIAPAPGPAINYSPPTLPETPKVDKNKIVDAGDLAVEAVFEGGINSFRNKVMSNFDGSGIESNGDVMKTTVTFIVEIDGSISGIKANGSDADFNSEAIRTIKSISNKGKWKPGKNKQGESVRSYFKFPISMKFE
ncbi:hypothetical protein ACM39_03825 [Chryseobacterium sp. FH2]|uniref:hypothetical protein n=1 Tax=Chryseobacterium sp. FH2 TaxID=1674291 RepID=UPI00065AD761|nr:hypothetical protein [Chryseobacterium sp. FH2]KMQ69240.1 hypothetical protein ACM39_03825 [Chryseobacterium sp. FH2]